MDKVGFYDPSYNYNQGKKYKIEYMITATSVLYDAFNASFKHWCSKMNIEYGGMWSAAGDNDAYINGISTFANQGCTGLLLDPDAAIYPRIAEILGQLKLAWMPCMGPPKTVDKGSEMLHPFVGFDYEKFGVDMADKLYEYAQKTWPTVKTSDIGFISFDYSLMSALHARSAGAQKEWKKLTGSDSNFLVADTATGGQLTMDAASNLATSTISANGKYKYWLIAALFDDLAQGAATAVDTLGLSDKSCIVAIGGTGLQKQWDAGQQDAWKFAEITPQLIYGEPIVGALYAMMSGQATPDTLWPSWVDSHDHGGTGHTYATLLLPAYWLDHETYKKFYKWADVYCGSNEYPTYDATGITRDSYKARMDVPASYAG